MIDSIQVYISSNGCNRRLLDAQRLKSYFILNGCTIVDNPLNANYIFFFASALNKVRIDESFEILGKLKKYKGEIIVLGCLMDVAPTDFSDFWKGKSLPVRDMNKIDDFFPGFKISYKDVPTSNIPVPSVNIYKTISPSLFLKNSLVTLLSPVRMGDKIYNYRHREKREDYGFTYIWVSSGCPNKCAFCAERKVVGTGISRPLEEIVAEYKQLLLEGKRNFEFIGDDVGSYGLDINLDLPHLLNKLNETDKDYKVNWVIKHLHPKFIIKYKDALTEIAQNEKIKEIICCFQSGNNRILELMNRQHTIEQVIEVLSEFRNILPHLKLATNIIVGFPTETDSDFEDTLIVFDRVFFDRVHMIRYYDAEGSDSHLFEPKVSDADILKRIKKAKVFLKQRKIYFQTRD
jgi:tRNA A37 methylthiotransferase MiaB